MISTNMEKEMLDANIESHIRPVLTLEALALSEGNDIKQDGPPFF